LNTCVRPHQPVPGRGAKREHGFVAQRLVIVAVLVAGEDAVKPLPRHLRIRVFGLVTSIDQAVGQPLRVAPPFVGEDKGSGVVVVASGGRGG